VKRGNLIIVHFNNPIFTLDKVKQIAEGYE